MTTAPTPAEIAGMIDHTVLKPDTDEPTVRRVINEAVEHRFASVCINPKWVSLTAEQLAGTGVRTCTVVGFPLGATTTAQKVTEAQEAIAEGADEIDMVVDIADANTLAADAVQGQIAAIAAATHAGGAILKVILETALLSEEAKRLVCQAAEAAGADFVKTSTGFAGGGATVEDIALMHQEVGGRLGIKASGGVRTYQDAVAVINAGATRIGASSSLDIVGVGNPSSDGGY
ncbi:deoxyribose-phosphate aldolase [Nesterenkonia sp. MY13]|uniref:Deoxyribose-phosphate aldolase n=1 Tax=Nesterenkonia sedimenti TaxID=1463632 RepID=A0A7X8TIV8_9MICC|nr:deoxyribose-phosphate aldolase [Nesterenkonia sedimenti]NLS08878.1 deoxyribose-phosphate aldolase [Nesterenkonia sedimenti]